MANPVNITDVISQPVAYNDTQWDISQNIYWADYVRASSGLHGSIGSMQFDRARSRIPQATLFGPSGAVSPLDINQGGVGDCYYLSSIAAEAETSSRITQAFITNYTSQGLIAVRGIVLGVPRIITMDDKIAFYGSYSSPYFAATSLTKSLWGPLLEKAWAKMIGNFELIEGGWEPESIRFASGAPTKTTIVTMNNAASALADWQAIAAEDAKNTVMIGGVGSTSTISLVTGHAYTIMSAHNVSTADGT